VVTVDPDTWSVADIVTDFAHNSDASDVQGIYELRLKTGGAGVSTTPQYDHAFIKVSGATWQVFDTGADNNGTGGSGGGNAPGTKTTSAVRVVASTAKPVYGRVFTVTVTVTASDVTPTGAVTLISGGTTLGSGNLFGGKVILGVKATALNAGAHTLTASYAGNDAVSPASGTTAVTVAKQVPLVSLTLGKATVKHSAKPKVTVKATATGLTFTGKVKVYDGSKVLKTVTLTSANKGKLVITLPSLKVGTHKLKAVSVAGTNLGAATSKPVNLKVTR
jgi:hypothetical protein